MPGRHVQTSEHSQKVSWNNQHAPLRRRRTSLPRGLQLGRTPQRLHHVDSMYFRNPFVQPTGRATPLLVAAPSSSFIGLSPGGTLGWCMCCRWCHKTLLESEREFTARRSAVCTCQQSDLPKLVLRPFDFCHARLLTPCDSQTSTHLAPAFSCNAAMVRSLTADRHNFDG